MKRTISVLLVLAMMLAGVLAMIPASAATPEGTAINSADDFAKMEVTGKYYLAQDITITAANPVKFTGTFDGNGKTITLSGANAAFSEVNGATIKNLIIAGDVVKEEGNLDAAGASVYGYGKFDNITNKVNFSVSVTDTTKAFGGKIGGIIAVVNGATTISNCKNEGTITLALEGPKADHYIGGIVGGTDDGKINGAKLIINNCTNSGAISSTQAAAYLGGIIGSARNVRLEMDSCVNTGNVTVQQKLDPNGVYTGQALTDYKNGAYTAAAGMIGGTYQGQGKDGLSVLMTNCTNNGKIEAVKGNNDFAQCLFVGGMLGRALHNNKFRAINCTNTGAVIAPFEDNGWNGAGGMIGTLMTIGYTWSGKFDGLGNGEGETIMENCKNTGAVTGKNAGGMWGSVYQMSVTNQVIKLQYCENSGAITGVQTAGGMIGQGSDSYSNASDITIKNCKNTGAVTADEKAAGIVATMPNLGSAKVFTIDSCVNTGAIKTNGQSADAGAAIAAGIVGFLATKAHSVPSAANGFPAITDTDAAISITNCVVSGTITKTANDNDRVAITLANQTHVNTSGNIYKTGVATDAGFATAKSEAECTTAANAIKTSVANVGTLESAIANATGFTEMDYTTASWSAYQTALADAKETLKNYETLAQSAVDTVATALQNAIDGLTLAPVDLTELNAAIAEVEAMNKKDYTSISWLRVDNAYKVAKVAATSLYQSEVNAALADLTNAIERLDEATKKDDTDDNTGDDGTTTPGGDDGATTPDDGDATNAPTGGDDAGEGEEKKGGCGSAITATAIVLTTVVALGAGVAFKKKED